MYNDWYPKDKEELNKILDEFLSQKIHQKLNKKEINGFIVPHAGYIFSGKIAGIFSLLKNKKIERVIIFGPSHYMGFYGIMALENFETPLGEVKIIKNYFKKLKYEHSIDNQIPFIQKITNDAKILPLVVGNIDEKEIEGILKEIIDKFENKNTIYVFSTDLSHFLNYDNAVKKDKETIRIIENLDFKNIDKIDACGKFPLMILMHLCRIKKWKPELIEYKNSGDITGEKSSVVGYASFVF